MKLNIFRKYVQKNSISIEIPQEQQVLYMKIDRCTFMISRGILLRKKNVSGKNSGANQNTVLLSMFFFKSFNL